MSSWRLAKRVPSATATGVFSLGGHVLRFHKTGRDGSAKGDAFFTGKTSDRLLGVLYTIACSEKPLLDEIEGIGNGYEEKEVKLEGEDGLWTTGFFYYATHINSALRPFSWYVHHVLWGAREAGLPASYVQEIERVQTIEDEDWQRDLLERSLYDGYCSHTPYNTNSERKIMDGKSRKNVTTGIRVHIVEKQHQRTGTLTKGVVKDILTRSGTHPHGIKVRLENGCVGRIKEILE